jgi:hypothetical protein
MNLSLVDDFNHFKLKKNMADWDQIIGKSQSAITKLIHQYPGF